MSGEGLQEGYKKSLDEVSVAIAKELGNLDIGLTPEQLSLIAEMSREEAQEKYNQYLEAIAERGS